VSVAATAALVAGANYQTLYQVAYAGNLLQDPFWRDSLSTLSGSMALTEAQREKLGLTGGVDYVVEYWDSREIALDLKAGEIVRLVAANAATAKGEVDAYYEFLGGGAGGLTPVSLANADYTDQTLWRKIGI